MTGVIVFANNQTFSPNKISGGSLPVDISITSANITNNTIVNEDISNIAEIDAGKIVSASTTGLGVVQLTNSYNTSSSTLAASATAVKGVWDALVARSEITVSINAPSSPSDGDLWWDSSPDIANAFIWYEDSDSSQWVPLVPGTPEVDYTRVVVTDSSSAQTLIGDILIPATTGSTSNSAAVTKLYVDDALSGENLWDRSGTTLSPNTAGDSADIAIAYTGSTSSSFGGALAVTGTVSAAAPTSTSHLTTKYYVDSTIAGEILWNKSSTTLSPKTTADVADIAIVYSGSAASSFGGSLTVTGAISTSSTVDGRDINADGVVLDAVANTYLPFTGCS